MILNGNPAKEVADFHNNDDTDSSVFAHHHTLGRGPLQAARGNHSHFSLGVNALDGTPSITSIPNDGVLRTIYEFAPLGIPTIENIKSNTARVFAHFSARAAANAAAHWRLMCNNIEVDYHLGHNYTDQYLNLGASLFGSFNLQGYSFDTLTVKITCSNDAAGTAITSVGPAHINVSFD